MNPTSTGRPARAQDPVPAPDRRRPGLPFRVVAVVLVALGAWPVAALTGISGAVVLTGCMIECAPLTVGDRLTGSALMVLATVVASTPIVAAAGLSGRMRRLGTGTLLVALVMGVALSTAVAVG